MKYLTSFLVIAGIISCSKKDAITTAATSNTVYQIRIAAVNTDGTRNLTPISLVKAGKVALEYETAEVSGVKEYQVEVSLDGTSFQKVKTIAADPANPNKIYRDTVVLE